MKYKAREFVEKSYNKNDNKGKVIFIKYLLNKGYLIENSEENYQHDIIAKKNNKIIYFEIEMKNSYPFRDRKSFKFDTVSFLGRKKRLHEINPFYYVIISPSTNCALVADSDIIYKDEYIEEFNIYTTDRMGLDKFYRLPKELCNFFYLGD